MFQLSAVTGLLLAVTHARTVPFIRQEVRQAVVDSSGVHSLDAETNRESRTMYSDHEILKEESSENLSVTLSEWNSNADKTSFTFTFADAFVNVNDGLNRLLDGQPLSENNKLTKQQRTIIVNSTDIPAQLHLTVPGHMRSANLFLFDVMVLPHQNMLAIFALGPRPSAFADSGSHAEEELNKLTVRLAFHPKQHELKCGIIDPRAIDGSGVGGSIIMLCQAPNVNISKAVQQAQQQEGTLAIQLGQELVHVSSQTLSAGQSGFTISRTFTSLPSSLSSGRLLKTSVVMPWFGKVPPYLAETMTYLRKVGVSHVYMGLYNLKVPGVKNALLKAAQPGFVSILELDAWKVFNWSHPYRYPIYEGLVMDWALYHAKGWDDLLLMHDYDELVVPRAGGNLNLAFGKVLSSHGLKTAAIDNLCCLVLCPLATYKKPDKSFANRTNRSRAEDFPFMDGGRPGASAPKLKIPLDHCREGGYQHIYAKSAVVVRNIYKASIHVPAACSAVSYREQVAGVWRAIGKMLIIKHDEDLVLQHWGGMFRLDGFTPVRHRANASIFTKVWGPQLL